jgi:acyl-CoA thioesterase-2
MSAAMQEPLSIIDLETLEYNLLRGRSPRARRQRVFGTEGDSRAPIAARRAMVQPRAFRKAAARLHMHAVWSFFLFCPFFKLFAGPDRQAFPVLRQ